ncbi:MAG: M28 family peptidase [Kiritimatiellia bacterium]|nr:M28 family peptidase [Kiritimatiellia bacterium]
MFPRLFTLLALFGCFSYSQPEFSTGDADSALILTRDFLVACPYRVSGTEGLKGAAEWISKRLRLHQGWLVSEQCFERNTPRGKTLFRNVLSAYRQAGCKRWILLLTHYDTKAGIANFTGANDGGSSTGLMLQLVDVLTKQPLRNHNVLVAFLDGEECFERYDEADGFQGSKALAVECRRKGWAVDAVILADMIGDREFTLAVPSNVTPSLRTLAATCAGGNLHTYPFEIWDDHKPFMDLGFPAIDFIDFDYGPSNKYWHTAEDTFDKLGPEGYLRTGRTILKMLRKLDR